MICADIKDRTVDYLYGELPDGERAEFDQHLAGCASCRAEVGALQGTLHQARAAVKATDEAPPARVRVAVMEAARAAAASAVPLAARAAARPEPKAAGPGGGFWAWLRGPWLMPLAGAAAAVAIFVLARDVILRPQGPAEMRREVQGHAGPAPSVVEPVPASPPPAASAEPPSLDEKAAPAEPQAKPKGRPAADLEGALGASRARPAKAKAANKGPSLPADSRFAQPPEVARRRAILEADDVLQEGAASGAARGGDDRPAQKESRDKLSGLRDGAGAGAALGRADSVGEKKQVSIEESKRELSKSAPVKVSAAAPAPAPTTAAAPPPPPRRPASPVSRPQARMPAAEAPPYASAPAAEMEATSAREESASRSKKDELSPLERQVQQADRLFTAGKWSQAAGAYRELLRQYPQHPSAVGWKGRLRACEQALAPAADESAKARSKK